MISALSQWVSVWAVCSEGLRMGEGGQLPAGARPVCGEDELAVEKTSAPRAVLSAFGVCSWDTARTEQRHKENKALYKHSFCSTA